MTVSELIAALSNYDMNTEVTVTVYDERGFSAFENITKVAKEVMFLDYTPKDTISLAITNNHEDACACLNAIKRFKSGKWYIEDGKLVVVVDKKYELSNVFDITPDKQS